MSTTAYPHILKHEGAPAHLVCWPRIRVAQIAADHLGNGWSAEEIVRQYPHLQPAEVYAALGYYFDHQGEIDGELSAELAAFDEMADQPPSLLRLRLLSARRNRAA